MGGCFAWLAGWLEGCGRGCRRWSDARPPPPACLPACLPACALRLCFRPSPCATHPPAPPHASPPQALSKNAWDSPLAHTHFKAEGDVEFKAVLFVPTYAPPGECGAPAGRGLKPASGLRRTRLFCRRLHQALRHTAPRPLAISF